MRPRPRLTRRCRPRTHGARSWAGGTEPGTKAGPQPLGRFIVVQGANEDLTGQLPWGPTRLQPHEGPYVPAPSRTARAIGRALGPRVSPSRDASVTLWSPTRNTRPRSSWRLDLAQLRSMSRQCRLLGEPGVLPRSPLRGWPGDRVMTPTRVHHTVIVIVSATEEGTAHKQRPSQPPKAAAFQEYKVLEATLTLN